MNTEEELALWLDHERSANARIAAGAGFGVPDPAALLRMSGMEALQAGLRGELPGAPMEETLNFRFLEAEPGRVLFQGSPQAQHRNPVGTAHGGWYAGVLDSAMTAAVYSLLPAGRGYTTLELSVNFVKAIAPKVRCLRAEGKVLHSGRQMATAEGRLYGPGNVLYAHAKTTCMLFDVAA